MQNEWLSDFFYSFSFPVFSLFFTLFFCLFLTQRHTRKDHTKFQSKRKQDGDCGGTKPTKQALGNRRRNFGARYLGLPSSFSQFRFRQTRQSGGRGDGKFSVDFRNVFVCPVSSPYEEVMAVLRQDSELGYGRTPNQGRKDSELGYGRTPNYGTKGLRIRVL